MFCSVAFSSETSLFVSDYHFGLGFKPNEDDFQHDFCRVTDKADVFVVRVKLKNALFREFNNQ